METEELAYKIELILIEEGQNDKKKFKLGEWIKYTPHEVYELIIKHKDEFD
jgi:hypothetical protein